MNKNQPIDNLQKFNKDNLIDELLKSTIKGGCCCSTHNEAGEIIDWFDPETGNPIGSFD